MFVVAGCNSECVGGCSLDKDTHVVGRFDRTGEVRFAGPEISGTPYECNTRVEIGDSVTLTASNSPTFDFVGWRHANGDSARDYCPCIGSTDRACHVRIDASISRSYDRAYCGAVWKPKAGARIAQ